MSQCDSSDCNMYLSNALSSLDFRLFCASVGIVEVLKLCVRVRVLCVRVL